jgi:hypothetical protein
MTIHLRIAASIMILTVFNGIYHHAIEAPEPAIVSTHHPDVPEEQPNRLPLQLPRPQTGSTSSTSSTSTSMTGWITIDW